MDESSSKERQCHRKNLAEPASPSGFYGELLYSCPSTTLLYCILLVSLPISPPADRTATFLLEATHCIVNKISPPFLILKWQPVVDRDVSHLV